MPSNRTVNETTAPLGTVEEAGGKHVLRFERRLVHPVEQVWAALTEANRRAEWLAEAELDLAVGGRVELRWQNPISAEQAAKYDIDTSDFGADTDEQGNAILHGTITRLDPPRLLEIDSDIHGLLRFELREEGPGCVLTFSSTLPKLDDHWLPMVLAGWQLHLELLDAALAGRPTDWPNWPIGCWAELRDRYPATLA